jgi:4-amino-4-deoxy-L-arabinose transferase-like glycosyltransferase
MRPPPSPDTRNVVFLLVSLVLLAAFAAAAWDTRPLIPVDETRYVGIAWEMWWRGDFLVPLKNGEVYSHKPPVLFWLIHLGWALFGVNEWWPRAVSPIFSAASILLTWRLARRLWPAQNVTGGHAALMLASAFLWMLFSTAVMFDVVLAFWVLLGMHGVLDARDGRRGRVLMLGVAIGFGALTKGPVVLLHLLPVAMLAPWWSPGIPTARWFSGVLKALLLGVAIALCWALPAALVGGEAYREAILWGQTADRMVESFAHRRPVWWYLPLLPLLLFPWFVWPGLWKAVVHKARVGLDPGTRFCVAWMLPAFAAFSFISGKQPHYLIPLFPAFALVAARALTDHEASPALPALLAALLGVTLMLSASGALPGLGKPQLLQSTGMWPGFLLLLLAVLVGLSGRVRVSPVLSLALLGAGTLTLMQAALMPHLAPVYDVKPMARAIAGLQERGAPVANVAKYHAQYQFLGRLKSPLAELRVDQLAAWQLANPRGYAVIYLKDLRKLDTMDALHTQRYRGGVAALVEASEAAKLLVADAVMER